MACRKIDMTQYPRREHFAYFCSLAYPYVGVTQNVDVTEFSSFCKAHGISFYLAFLHAAALAADSIPALRQRIQDGGIVEYDECPTSHIELLPDETYCYCTLLHHMPFDAYLACAEAERCRCRERASIEEDSDAQSLYFISTLPWLHYTALLQPVAGGSDSNPRITWGRFETDAHGRRQMPVTLLAHHALVDGIHIARFYQRLEEQLASLAQSNVSAS